MTQNHAQGGQIQVWVIGASVLVLVTLGGALFALRPSPPERLTASSARATPVATRSMHAPQPFATFSPLPTAVEAIGQPLPDEGNRHIMLSEQPHYQHFPPASGPHFLAPLQAGYYSTPVAEASYVHNLEHGYIVVLYNRRALSRESVDQLRALLATLPAGKYGAVKLVVAPYDGSEQHITALAWDRELVLDQVDADQLRGFYQAYVDHGPEDIP